MTDQESATSWREKFPEALDGLRTAGEDVDDPNWTHKQVLRRLGDGDFWEHLRTSDLIGLILRTHLWVEQRLTEAIEMLLPFPEHLSDRMPFAAKLRLSMALGGDAPYVAPVRELNKLRNRAAHRLHWSPDEQDQRDFIATLGDDPPLPPDGDLTFQFAVALVNTALLMTFVEVHASRLMPLRYSEVREDDAAEMEAMHNRAMKRLLDDGLVPFGDYAGGGDFTGAMRDAINRLAGREVPDDEPIGEIGIDIVDAIELALRDRAIPIEDYAEDLTSGLQGGG